MNHLKKLKADVCLLQETKLSDSEHKKLKTQHFNQIYYAAYNSKKRGISIMINKNTPLIHKHIISDPEGRYIIISRTINNVSITIANIYGPNTDDPTFYHDFFTSLQDFLASIIIIGGDFNTVINPIEDSATTSHHTKNWHSTQIIKQYMMDLGLGDSWRLQNPSVREYTFYSPVHQSFSRIDYFLTSNFIMADISKPTIHPIIISDQAPISFTL